MKKSLLVLMALLLCLTAGTALAGDAPKPELATTNLAAVTPQPTVMSTNDIPGKELARTISLITGVAISPLLGVGTVGAVDYFKAKTPEQKARLHWYANPWFWIPALVIVAMCFIKDTAGTALPTAVKKPFDVAETIEHKISGLVATGAFVPIAAAIFSADNGTGDGAMLSLSSLGFASIDLSWLYNAISVPIAMVAFFIVFLASNAINVLILLSPFTTVDAALKSFRVAILASVVGTSYTNPWMGAAWALVIIFVSWLIAGWSFRLSHFGLAFVWDYATFRHSRFKPDPKANKVFLGRKINKVPIRTYGRVLRDDAGNLIFKYRPWLVLPRQTMTLPEGKYIVGKGMFFSEIQKLDGEKAKTSILLPPRYLGHEDELTGIYGLAGVRDIGLRAAWAWLKTFLGLSEKVQPQAA